MGLQGHRSLDRLRGQWPRQDEGAGRPRGLSVDAGSVGRVEEGGEAAARQLGGGGEEGRRRSSRDRRRFAGGAEEVRGGDLRGGPVIPGCAAGAGPESILTIVVMDSGLVLRTPRNDESLFG